MRTKHLVVIGTSAGGIEALRALVAALPPDFPAAIAVCMHTAPQSPAILPDILMRSGRLPASHPRNGDTLSPGRIYVAPPDYHLLIEPGRMRLSKGPRENRFRPAIDPLFRSAASVYGPGSIGVILTGNLGDGAAGLWAIKQLGGIAIVQDPGDAMFPSMPQSALRVVNADYCIPLDQIAPLLTQLTSSTPPDAARPPAAAEGLEIEVKIAKDEHPLTAGVTRLGRPSPFACPECHGVLLQVEEGGRIRFRCHTGHAYSAESLQAEIGEAIEVALWNAIRSLQEGTLCLQRMAQHQDTAHAGDEAAALMARAREMEQQADTLREMVTSAAPGAAK